MAQLHKRFTDEQIKELLSRYVKREIKRRHIQEILGIRRRRFCDLVRQYLTNPKGKIERPYEWIQDHLVRTCVRENVTQIHQALPLLREEVRQYNYRRVHSTTGEVPYFRFQKAQKEKISLFRQFAVKPPFQSAKDVFCLRMNRVADSYRKISLHTAQLKVNGVDPQDSVNLRIHPLERGLCEVRFWCKDQLVDVQRLKSFDFKGVHF